MRPLSWIAHKACLGIAVLLVAGPTSETPILFGRWDCNTFEHGSAHPLPDVPFAHLPPPAGCAELASSLGAPPSFRYRSITVFTGQHPRHLSLVRDLAGIADLVYVVHEVAGSLIPSTKRTEPLKSYFERVSAAEKKLFGLPHISPANVRHISMMSGDASHLPLEVYGDALNSDVFVVFGASFLKGELGQLLEDRLAINCHIGMSPYYRGAATTFWAMWDGNPHYVGATIHHLTSRLDGGDIICHAVPTTEGIGDSFEFTMKAVRVCHEALRHLLVSGSVWRRPWVKQNRALEVKHVKKAAFTEEVAAEWLERNPSAAAIDSDLASKQKLEDFVHCFRA